MSFCIRFLIVSVELAGQPADCSKREDFDWWNCGCYILFLFMELTVDWTDDSDWNSLASTWNDVHFVQKWVKVSAQCRYYAVICCPVVHCIVQLKYELWTLTYLAENWHTDHFRLGACLHKLWFLAFFFKLGDVQDRWRDGKTHNGISFLSLVHFANWELSLINEVFETSSI